MAKERFETLDEALAALARLVDRGARPEPDREVLGRSYPAVRQVAGRFELRGPRVRGGIDVRGDGSAEAYRGWIRKAVVTPEDDETVVQALGRALKSGR